MRPSVRTLALVVAAALSTTTLEPATALAQSPDARETARPLAEKGYEAFEAKRWAEAIDYFRRAEAVFHAVPHLLFIARAQVASGKLVAANATYDAIVKEQLANYAPDAFRQAQEEARQEHAALAKRIPRLAPVVSGADAAGVRLNVDGVELPGWNVAGGVPLDPGAHTVVATSDGGVVVERRVELREGETARVELAFAQAPAAPGPPPDAPEPTPAPSTGGSRVPAIVAFSVGGVGLAVGAITGFVSLGKVSDIESQCRGTDCPASLQGDADSAAALGNVSTVAFVIGGVGVGAGIVLLAVGGGGGDSAPAAAVRVGPGRLSLGGVF